MIKTLKLNYLNFSLLNASSWPKISYVKVKGRSDEQFDDQPAPYFLCDLLLIFDPYVFTISKEW